MENATPMLRQYLEIKQEHPGTILFFRLGDFYEMFNEDAVVGSRELDITLTARQKDSANPIPMCGIPHHSAASYIAKLVRKGYRVAICEQAETATKGTKLVKREVVKVVTPGTAVDSLSLEAAETAYLASIFGVGERFGAAFLELSTGEFFCVHHAGASAWRDTVEDIESFAPKELLYPASLKPIVNESFVLREAVGISEQDQARSSRYTLTPIDDHNYNSAAARDSLAIQFGVRELTAFAIDDKPEAVSAAAACLAYAKDTQKAAAAHISAIRFLAKSDYLVLDAVTLRNLEIVEARGESRNRSLFGVINETVTGMGARLLKSWLLRPAAHRAEIEGRHEAVGDFSDSMTRGRVRELLKEVYDLERLVGRLNLGTASARDLLSLRNSLSRTPEVMSTLKAVKGVLLKTVSTNIHPLPEVQLLISNAISDEPPVNLADGGTIRDGFDRELDELRNISRSAKQIIASYEDEERTRTGISSLKVRFNNVFGYYIEISKSNLSKVPEGYERKQTLANAERFTTPHLKEWEQKVLGAEERSLQIESDLFNEVRSAVRAETKRLQDTARALAALDAISSLAETAVKRGYVRPRMHDSDEMVIQKGRHPIVEAFSRGEFVPNDLELNNSTDRLLIITGPNMGGKSTILRQIALIQLMAQAGSFVPASAASLPIVDRIWTRVGASDDLASGRSTFMVEMTETASILHNATARSLVLLDEIGRGTSTFDGLSIAWAVAEYMHNSPEHGAKTLFATHYHELTELVGHLPGAKNYRVLASQKDGDVVFLHRLEEGKATESYGVAVAKLAGLPGSVIARAKDVLARLERYELAVMGEEGTFQSSEGPSKKSGAARRAAQVSLFAVNNEGIVDELRSVEVENLSDPELRELLVHLKNRVI